jgi:hypothetical protein
MNKIEKETREQQQKALDAMWAEIIKELPVIVFRNWWKWRDVFPCSPRTVANDDVLKLGPREKVYVGRNAGYPRQALVDYFKAKSRISGMRGC